MKRLTTDNPMSTLETCLNLCFAKDGEAWVRGYGEKGVDITLNDLTRIIIERFRLDISPGIEPYDDLPQNMYDALEDGLASMEGITALMYCFSWVAAELRERLKRYEDTGLSADQIQEAVDLFRDSGADVDIPKEIENWVERCTWHVRKCSELHRELEKYRELGTIKDLEEMKFRLEGLEK